MTAFHLFLSALAGATISLSMLVAIAVGLGWDGMPWTIMLLASALAALLSANRCEPPTSPRSR
jgi:hypothetical protein